MSRRLPSEPEFRIPGLPPLRPSGYGADGLPLDLLNLPYHYAQGAFPMAIQTVSLVAGAGAANLVHTDGQVGLFEPSVRAIFNHCRLRPTRCLRRALARGRFRVTFDTAFEATVAGCADRPGTWINAPLRRAYRELHAAGVTHSVEAWLDGCLVGGVFGLALGRVFVGESMFHRATDASRVALAHLLARLCRGGFTLFDAQVPSPHLARLGATELPQEQFVPLLRDQVTLPARFLPEPESDNQEVLQWSTQTS